MAKIIEIDEGTRIPIKIVSVIVLAVFGAATWVTTIAFNVDTAKADIRLIKRKLSVLQRLDHRLYRLELANHIEVPADEQTFENDEQ